VRPDAKPTIDALKAMGLEVGMLTGDNTAEARRKSDQLGIPVAASCATPDVKLAHVKKLQGKGHKVMMVMSFNRPIWCVIAHIAQIGDGVNDGPSLAAADVGIMIAHGRKCLSFGGSVLVLQSKLAALLTLLDIAKTTSSQVSANIAWALAYNVVAVALAVGVGIPDVFSLSPYVIYVLLCFADMD